MQVGFAQLRMSTCHRHICRPSTDCKQKVARKATDYKRHTPSASYAEGVCFAYGVYIGQGRPTSLFVGLVATATAATTLTTEAIAAVDGPVATGQERYGCLIAAFGANHAVHLAGTTVETETAVG